MASNEHVYEHSTGSEMVDDDIQIQSGMEDMSIEDLTSRLNLFKKPQRLIYTDQGGQLEVDTNVLSQLSQVNMKISVVCVCGSYRTGKSYLMNWIAGDKTGFDLGDTVHAKTKGIWIWCRQHPTQSDQVLVLLDTEGFGDLEKADPEHDNNMFCLALLMSSTLIINVKSVIEYPTLKELNFIAKLPETIKVLDDKAEDKHNAKTIKVAFPTLIICIRDFFLDIKIDGRLQTANEYLEDSLKSVNLSTSSEKQQKKQKKSNKVKEGIKAYFEKRTCFTIAQPASNEDLKNIETLDETSLDKSFVKNIKALQSYVYGRKPKYICNVSKKPLQGPDFTNLITSYVNALKTGSTLKCQEAYGQAAFKRNERVLNKVLTKFKKDMNKLQHIENKEKLQTEFLPLFEKACSKYREDSFVYRQDKYEEKLQAEMIAHFNMMKKEIDKTCMENGTKALSKMYDEMQKRNKSRYLTDKATSYSNYEADMEKLKQEFFEAKKLYDKNVLYECFDEFLKSQKSDDKMALYRDSTGKKYKDEYDELHQIILWRMDDQLKRLLEAEQRRRNRYLEMELEMLRAEYEELNKSVSRRSFCSIM